MAGLAGVFGSLDEPDCTRRCAAMASSQQAPGRGELATWQRRVANNIVALALGAHGPRASPAICTSASGRYALAFAGEIHNAADLAVELRLAPGAPNDVVLAALIADAERALPLLNGAWTLAFADTKANKILLARDHLGIAPLYVHVGDRGLFFASEIKAILAGTEARFGAEPIAVARFLDQTLLDAQPVTFFAGIEAFPPASFAWLDLAHAPRAPAPVVFWQVPDRDACTGSDADRISAVRSLVHDSVRRRLADGSRTAVLLSGGVDSSSIAAAAVAAAGDRVQLLSGVSTDPRARDTLLDAMCAHLGRSTHAVALTVDAATALPALAEVIARNDEPVRSFITVTEHRLKQAARELGFDVVVSGLGADEVFAGNLVHMVFYVQALLRSGRWLRAAHMVAAAAVRRTIRPRWRTRVQKRYFPALARDRHLVLGPALDGVDFRCDVGLGKRSAHARLLAELAQLALPALLHFDHRTSSAFGVATRLPYLDHRLVSLVAPMAPEHKLRGGYTKWLLRRAMAADLPAHVVWRKVKQGRTDAYGEWLKRDMRAPITALLAGELASASLGLVDADALRARYAAFCAQRPDAGMISAQDVFNPIALELWARAFAGSLRAP